MKIRQICMLVLLCLGVIPAVQAQTYDKLWKQVEQAEKKSLPETVIKELSTNAESVYVADEIPGYADPR